VNGDTNTPGWGDACWGLAALPPSQKKPLVPREPLDRLSDSTVHAMFVDLVGLTTPHPREAAESSKVSVEYKRRWLLRQ